MIKAVFLDVDGTLTDLATREVPESAVAAVEQARANGVKVFISTGRHTMTETERRVISHIEFDGYVALNGQLCHTGNGEVYYENPLDRGDVTRLLALVRQRGIPCLVVDSCGMSLTEMNERVREFHGIVDIELPALCLPDDSFEREIFSLGPYTTVDEDPMIAGVLRHSMITRWHPLAVDIIPDSGGKHVGVQKTLERFGLTREQTIAFGDGENDISMLKYCGIGVAMAQSVDEVKRAADDVAPAAGDDGIYRMFKKYNII